MADLADIERAIAELHALVDERTQDLKKKLEAVRRDLNDLMGMMMMDQ